MWRYVEFLEIGKVFSVRKGTAFALLRNIRFQKYFLNVHTIFPSSKFETFRQRIPREYLRSINSYRSVNVFIKYYYEFTASRISPNTNNNPPSYRVSKSYNEDCFSSRHPPICRDRRGCARKKERHRAESNQSCPCWRNPRRNAIPGTEKEREREKLMGREGWNKKNEKRLRRGRRREKRGNDWVAGCSRRSNFQNGSSSIKQVLVSPYVHPKRSANPSQNVRRIPTSVGCRKDSSSLRFSRKVDPEGLARFVFSILRVSYYPFCLHHLVFRIMRHRVMILKCARRGWDQEVFVYPWIYCLYFFIDWCCR